MPVIVHFITPRVWFDFHLICRHDSKKVFRDIACVDKDGIASTDQSPITGMKGNSKSSYVTDMNEIELEERWKKHEDEANKFVTIRQKIFEKETTYKEKKDNAQIEYTTECKWKTCFDYY
jgi:hypothetical protein